MLSGLIVFHLVSIVQSLECMIINHGLSYCTKDLTIKDCLFLNHFLLFIYNKSLIFIYG